MINDQKQVSEAVDQHDDPAGALAVFEELRFAERIERLRRVRLHRLEAGQRFLVGLGRIG